LLHNDHLNEEGAEDINDF